MIIGINASAAIKKQRTGVEEYVYQLLRHLVKLEEAKKHRFIFYTSKNLKWPLPMWTQIRLAAEMAISKPDVLFIPVHVLPLIHPKNSVVTIHGLEYEYYPEMYPWRHLKYLRWSTKYALKNARKIIAVSESTKNDLVELYGAKPKKIEVVYHGAYAPNPKSKIQNPKLQIKSQNLEKYILFIGRLETKKNVQGLIEAFGLLKEKYKVPHKLILAGPKGVISRASLFNTPFFAKKDVLKRDALKFLGYISEQKKRNLLENADLFVLPSFYEGFGLPILEAQTSGCPVITSNVSSMPEVAGDGAMLIDPKNIEQIAETMYKVISDSQLKNTLIEKGYQNIKRFSWQKCAKETLKILLESS